MSTVLKDILWIDLETTGLDPGQDKILEWAAIIADQDLNPLDMKSGIIHYPHSTPPKMSDYVRKMHTDNNLLHEVHSASPDKTLANAETELYYMALDVQSNAHSRVMVAGNSPHFDLSFLKVHMPTLAKELHYRVFDVTSVMTATCLFLGRTRDDVDFRRNEKHRATADIVDSVLNALKCKQLLDC